MDQSSSDLQSAILENALRERRRLPVGYAAAAKSVFALPLIALAALALTTVLRWVDVDPLLGSPGYVLCPAVCEGCTGPWRVVTHWRRNWRGGWSTKEGPQYFCPSPTNGIASLTLDQLRERRASFSDYELVLAPAAASYLVWFLLLLPLVPFHAMHAVNAAKAEAAALETDIVVAARELGVPTPAPPPAPTRAVLIKATGVALASAALALIVIGVEFALRALF